MKIKITALSSYNKQLIVEGELLQTIEDLRQGKIDISTIVDDNSWLYNSKTDSISNPNCFIVDYDITDCDVEVTIYDYYND